MCFLDWTCGVDHAACSLCLNLQYASLTACVDHMHSVSTRGNTSVEEEWETLSLWEEDRLWLLRECQPPESITLSLHVADSQLYSSRPFYTVNYASRTELTLTEKCDRCRPSFPSSAFTSTGPCLHTGSNQKLPGSGLQAEELIVVSCTPTLMQCHGGCSHTSSTEQMQPLLTIMSAGALLSAWQLYKLMQCCLSSWQQRPYCMLA
jgi:hypothetical protein